MSEFSGERTRIAERKASAPLGPKDASLVQIYGPDLGHRFVLDRPVLTIGRDRSNDIVLEDDDSVSRTHARISNRGGTFVFEDLGSTNGSLVNDQDITDEHPLRNGDLIKIGSAMFKFITGGNAEALYHEEIYKMTITDGLTGVANRRYFKDFLEREYARASRYERPLSLVMFDIDHFKAINDKFGHLGGDYVLRRLATQLQERIRREELLARYGGEEFALVMPETGIDKAQLFGEKLRARIEQTPFEYDGQVLPVTTSVGVATLRPSYQDVEQFVRAADEALYRAKRTGRNRVCLDDP